MKTHPRRGLYSPELLESRIAPATFIVTSLDDPAADTPGTLRHAIDQANGHSGPDTVTFDPTLTGTIHVNNTEITIMDTITIKGPGIDILTVSGNDLRRIFNIDDGSDNVLHPATISGLTFIDGKTTGKGGAIYSKESLTLRNVVVASSYAMETGGGVGVHTDGKASITGCRIVKNEAAGSGGGGGLYLDTAAGVSVVRTTIADNKAPQAGGLYARASASKSLIVLDKLVVARNSATVGDGGGIALDGPNDGRITLKNSLITGNSAASGGGGLYFDDGNLIINKTNFSGNSAAVGGAIADEVAKSLKISGAQFLANKATDGSGNGGGALYLKGSSLVKISGSLFSGNDSANRGGAISTENNPVTLKISGTTFLGNHAANSGGAILLEGQSVLTLKDSTLSGNVSAGGKGGAIFADLGSSITATGNRFTENRAAASGGAIHAYGMLFDAVPVSLSANLFQGNVATEGGAVYAKGTAPFTSKGDKVIGNVANTLDGGGFYLGTSGAITITDSLFRANAAGDDGGGMKLLCTLANITGVKVRDNAADGSSGFGGGIRVQTGTVSIANSLITGNVASRGGGIDGTAGTTIPGTSVTGNFAFNGPNTFGVP